MNLSSFSYVLSISLLSLHSFLQFINSFTSQCNLYHLLPTFMYKLKWSLHQLYLTNLSAPANHYSLHFLTYQHHLITFTKPQNSSLFLMLVLFPKYISPLLRNSAVDPMIQNPHYTLLPICQHCSFTHSIIVSPLASCPKPCSTCRHHLFTLSILPKLPILSYHALSTFQSNIIISQRLYTCWQHSDAQSKTYELLTQFPNMACARLTGNEKQWCILLTFTA